MSQNKGVSPDGDRATHEPSPDGLGLPVGVPNAEAIAREAFKAGWKERDRNPGLKRVQRRSLNNAIRSAIGGGRFNEYDLVPDHRKYHGSIWINSSHRADLAKAMEAQRAETGTGSVHDSAARQGLPGDLP